MQYFVSFLVSICDYLDGKEMACWFNFIVCLMSCDCYCSLSLPHSAIGVSYFFVKSGDVKNRVPQNSW